MTKYILHGGFAAIDNKENRGFFAEFLKDVPEEGVVLFVYFATRVTEKTSEKFAVQANMCRAVSQKKNLEFRIAKEEEFAKQIRNAHAIFFNGGKTSRLLTTLRAQEDLRPYVEGKVVAGSSAGAYVLATLGAAHSGMDMREGLGFVPLRLVCHHESPVMPPSADSVEALTNAMPDLPLVKLKDYEWKVFYF